MLEGLRNAYTPRFQGIFFRRTKEQFREGGLWDECAPIYTQLGARSNETSLTLKFPYGARFKYAHLQHEKTKFEHQGKAYAFIGFDELTHFSEGQFWYLMTRNRSTCGVKPYIRGTCNPDPDSWVAKFIEWWINQDTGLAIPERSGVIRYFYKSGDDIHWADDRMELIIKFKDEIVGLYKKIRNKITLREFCGHMVKSFTFISSSIFDNQKLLEADPSYLANLNSQDQVTRERLLHGNWKIRPEAGLYFRREWFKAVSHAPADLIKVVRSWDLAGTEKTDKNDPDRTAGVLMGIDAENRVYILDVYCDTISPLNIEKIIRNLAEQDKAKYGGKYTVTIPQDPGQAGKFQATWLGGKLNNFRVKKIIPSGDKVTRASSFSAQVEIGNVYYVVADWNDKYISELEGFPDVAHDDMVDGSSDAYNTLVDKKKKFRVIPSS